MNENRASELCTAIQHWLAFQLACGRVSLFSEAYLAQPVGEFCMAHHSGNVVPEWTPPEFETGEPGHPRQIDYVLESRDRGRLRTAIEAKWVGSSAIYPQAICDDLLRLERIRDPSGQSVMRYFMIAGRTVDFDSKLVERNVQTTNGYQSFLPQILRLDDRTIKKVRVLRAHRPWGIYFQKFAEAYDVQIPRGFNTKLVKYAVGSGVSVAMWRITSRRNRRTFKVDADEQVA